LWFQKKLPASLQETCGVAAFAFPHGTRQWNVTSVAVDGTKRLTSFTALDRHYCSGHAAVPSVNGLPDVFGTCKCKCGIFLCE